MTKGQNGAKGLLEVLTMKNENTYLVIHVQIWHEINRKLYVGGVNRATASKQISTGNLN